MKVIVVGGGIAGMAIGWRLAQAGADVEVYDRGLVGRGATWAAAGMLAPGAELQHESDELTRFAHLSRAAWPGFAAELETESGTSVGYSEPGSLITALDDVQAQALERRAVELRSKTDSEWLRPAQMLVREPALSPGLRGALYLPGDAQVDNRLAADALRIALTKRHVAVHENTEVRQLLIEGGKVHGVVSACGSAASDAVIVASGAWLNGFGGAADLPLVSPVKGQMVAVQPPEGGSLPSHLLWGDNVYLVPRRDRLLIGATVEDAGFDTSVSSDACSRLITAAARIVPALAKWRVSEMWAGLRPRAPDGAPVIGACEVEGLYVAGGQFRNGILFAPLVADVVRRLVLTSEHVPEISAFSPVRFAHT